MIKIPNSGYKQSLFWGNETAYGSAGAINRSIGLVQSVNPTETNSLMKIRTLGGTRDYSNIVPGKFEVTGSFDYFLQDGAFLRQGWSEDTGTTAVVDSGPRVHTGASYLHIMGSAASPTVDCFPSFTLEFSDDEGDCAGVDYSANNLYRLYDGCRVNSMTLSGTVDEAVKVSVDWQAQSVNVSTAGKSAVTESTVDPYVFYQGVVYATTGDVTAYDVIESGARLAEVNSFDVSVNNNLEPIWYISGTTSETQSLRGLKQLIPKGRDYESSLNLNFTDKTMYERFLGAEGATTDQGTLTSYNIVLDFVRSGAIGSDPKLETDDWMRVVLRNCLFNDINIAGAPEDLVSENIGVFVEASKLYVVDTSSSYSD